MTNGKPFAFDNIDTVSKPSEVTRMKTVSDFVLFLLVSAGYIIQVFKNVTTNKFIRVNETL